MKNRTIIIAATALLLASAGCSDQLPTADSMADVPDRESANWQDSVSSYSDQARRGDGAAYLKLASCYHDGRGVTPDFLMTYEMASMAEQYGAVTRWKDYFLSLPADDPYRLTLEAMDDAHASRYADALSKAERLAELHSPDAELIKGCVALDKDEEHEAMAFFAAAAAAGSSLAQMAVISAEDSSCAEEAIASRLPSFYCIMARNCFNADYSPEEDEQAAHYYKMADDRLCLDRTGVRWLLAYYEQQAKAGCLVADSLTIARLRLMASRLRQY
ncbi:MAG: hypothetical protein K6B13_08405 [Prevotella sp.]|nr:hypothetical protein [Prevotella sp.]